MSIDSSSSTNASTASVSVGALAAMGGMLASAKDSFNKSGGTEVLSTVSASIPQGTKDLLNDAKTKFFSRDQLRSPYVFFGIGEEKPFYVEKVASLLAERIRHNLTFFYLNYTLLTAVLFCLTLVISPGAIIGIGLLGFAWLALIKSTAEGSLKIGPVSISQKQATSGMAVLSALILFYLLRRVFWWTVGSSGCIVGVHAFLRDASMHKDAEDKIEMTGDIGISSSPEEEAAFLNSPGAAV
mmetsp:Transcript_585/g.718  ORF Transcript_585/g.718 Transcript_585/m.718 type:complete len:241 (-) Transcript_585:197-919(-)|eukprot:CAMPEP_0203640954 /NCGR_PEP_ID=MMETSP0088-20131115/6322_1 /ASSEMBLY_ACC=CAM_ASM_001087 /TAXON_ID=426623 /ORGANISM="Chaetoceros affinis, Strain CCMP159" /LENGTH=240 /DNA_ID=CAMNT_0050496285 /DNA_START=93 /DNA_END=815 /DNA_ORIENTATION=+